MMHGQTDRKARIAWVLAVLAGPRSIWCRKSKSGRGRREINSFGMLTLDRDNGLSRWSPRFGFFRLFLGWGPQVSLLQSIPRYSARESGRTYLSRTYSFVYQLIEYNVDNQQFRIARNEENARKSRSPEFRCCAYCYFYSNYNDVCGRSFSLCWSHVEI